MSSYQSSFQVTDLKLDTEPSLVHCRRSACSAASTAVDDILCHHRSYHCNHVRKLFQCYRDMPEMPGPAPFDWYIAQQDVFCVYAHSDDKVMSCTEQICQF